jgi:hypothetical protein
MTKGESFMTASVRDPEIAAALAALTLEEKVQLRAGTSAVDLPMTVKVELT